MGLVFRLKVVNKESGVVGWTTENKRKGKETKSPLDR